jgi:hypothetical protein
MMSPSDRLWSEFVYGPKKTNQATLKVHGTFPYTNKKRKWCVSREPVFAISEHTTGFQVWYSDFLASAAGNAYRRDPKVQKVLKETVGTRHD